MTRSASFRILLRYAFAIGISIAAYQTVACSTPSQGAGEEESAQTGSGGGSSSGGIQGGGASGGQSSGGASTGGLTGGTGGANTGAGNSGGTNAGGTGGTDGTDGTGGGTGGASTAVKSSGCGKTPTLEFGPVPGESAGSMGFGDGGYVRIQSGGGERGFAVRLPDNYDSNQPYALIFGFHWNGGNSKEVDSGGSNGYNMAHFGLQKLSNNGAIFVAPDGLGGGWANTGGRDLQFVDDMVALIEENYCVDKTRLFANGFSYGGMMSHAVACARADVFRGVAIYDGAELSGCEGGNDPIAYWIMAGLEDSVCTIDMAKPMRDRFVTNNGCTPQGEPSQPPKGPPYLNPGGHVCTDYADCQTGYPVRWCVHQSGHGNAVVDGTNDLWNRCATPPNNCSDDCPCTWVPEDVWTFFNSL